MSTPHPFDGRPDRAFLMALLALVVAAVLGGYGIYLHFADRDAQQKRLQDALCGLVVPISQQPPEFATSPIGRTLISASGKSARVVHCPSQ